MEEYPKKQVDCIRPKVWKGFVKDREQAEKLERLFCLYF